jgi:SAM-dependent methyltransferase
MNRILFRMLQDVAGDRRFNRVLEAGCGTGYFASLLKERGWPVCAIDLGMEGLRYARGSGIDRIAQADVRHLPFPDESFDALFSMDVLVHMQRGEESQALRELARVIEPGGLLVMRVSAFDLLRSRHSEFVGENQRFTRGRLLRQARNAGFHPIRCTYANALLLPVALAKFRLWEPLTGQKPASGVQPVHPTLNKMLHAPLALESRLIGAGINLPVGQSVVLAARKQ